MQAKKLGECWVLVAPSVLATLDGTTCNMKFPLALPLTYLWSQRQRPGEGASKKMDERRILPSVAPLLHERCTHFLHNASTCVIVFTVGTLVWSSSSYYDAILFARPSDVTGPRPPCHIVTFAQFARIIHADSDIGGAVGRARSRYV